MELRPHDLIRTGGVRDLVAIAVFPDWAVASLDRAPLVVVRRAALLSPTVAQESPGDGGLGPGLGPGFVPVGIRGFHRGQRMEAWIRKAAIREVITPRELSFPWTWDLSTTDPDNTVFLSLLQLIPLLNEAGLFWGPTGSIGFQLASGVATLTRDSDLDILISCSRPISVDNARALLGGLEAAALCRLDIQLDTPLGGVALREYVSSPTVLVKTAMGPLLVSAETLWDNQHLKFKKNEKRITFPRTFFSWPFDHNFLHPPGTRAAGR